MRSNISLNLIKKINVIINTLFISILFVAVLSNGNMCYANKVMPVAEIEVLSEKETADNVFIADVRVKFNDLSKYNDAIYLSYHISDSPEYVKSPERGIFENERFNVVLNENNSATLKIQLDCSRLDYSDVYVQFDLVDQNNAYWFSLAESNFISCDFIHVYNKGIKAFAKRMSNEISNNLFIFILNCIAVIITIVIIIYIKKKRILTFKRSS